MAKAKQDDKPPVLTPKGRVSFPKVFNKSNYSGKFEITLLFPPEADLSGLKKALKEAVVEKWGAKIPKRLRHPFRDCGEKEDLDGYEPGWTFISFRNDKAPGVIDESKNEIISAHDLYAGCWARVSCDAFTYGPKSKEDKFLPGASFGLRNIQKMGDDDPFGATVSAACDDFGGAAGGPNDPASYGGKSSVPGVPDEDDGFFESEVPQDNDLPF